MSRIRLAIVEDDRAMRESLARLIAMEEDIEVVGTACDGKAGLDLARAAHPDVVLTDIAMPRMNGIELTRALKREQPEAGIVVLTIYHDDDNVFAAIKAGARGYLLKDSPPEDAVAAVRAIARGDSLLHPSVAGRVLNEFARVAAAPAMPETFSELTEREVEVLKEVATGRRNREIAERLFISEKTVKNHISSILFKLELNDRTEAALLAARQGLV